MLFKIYHAAFSLKRTGKVLVEPAIEAKIAISCSSSCQRLVAFSPECLSSSDSNDDDEDEELIIGAGLGSGPILQNFIWPKMATITSCPSFNDFFINLNFDLDIFFKLDHFDNIILSTKLNCSGSYNYFSKSIANFATIRLRRHTDWYLRQFVPVKLLIIILLFSTCPSFEAKATNLLFCFQGILTLSDISRKAHNAHLLYKLRVTSCFTGLDSTKQENQVFILW